MRRQHLYILLLGVSLSCGNNPGKRIGQPTPMANPVKYAKGFLTGKTDTSTVVEIFNPWQGALGVQLSYQLIPRKNFKELTTDSCITIPVPLRRVVCMSTSYLAYIEALNGSEGIVGISGTGYVYSEKINSLIGNGKILDVGYDQGLNYERIAQLKPDVVLCYGVGSESISYLSKLKEMGIRLMFIGDYLESDPLGKAEWIKVFGCLLGQEQRADSIFTAVEHGYRTNQCLASGITEKPTVFLNLPYRDVWYFPGGNNYLSKLISDAGGNYIFSHLTGSVSYPVSFEKSLEGALNSDIWINTGTAMSLNDIEEFDSRLVNVPPFKNSRVFNNNQRLSPGGGNDFWESGALRPDLILHDLMAILHPEMVKDSNLYYYRKLR
ncbi:MAG: ABC transporter substrate-binding protein [Bacteroidales bacterium]